MLNKGLVALEFSSILVAFDTTRRLLHSSVNQVVTN